MPTYDVWAYYIYVYKSEYSVGRKGRPKKIHISGPKILPFLMSFTKRMFNNTSVDECMDIYRDLTTPNESTQPVPNSFETVNERVYALKSDWI